MTKNDKFHTFMFIVFDGIILVKPSNLLHILILSRFLDLVETVHKTPYKKETRNKRILFKQKRSNKKTETRTI